MVNKPLILNIKEISKDDLTTRLIKWNQLISRVLKEVFLLQQVTCLLPHGNKLQEVKRVSEDPLKSNKKQIIISTP